MATTPRIESVCLSGSSVNYVFRLFWVKAFSHTCEVLFKVRIHEYVLQKTSQDMSPNLGPTMQPATVSFTDERIKAAARIVCSPAPHAGRRNHALMWQRVWIVLQTTHYIIMWEGKGRVAQANSRVEKLKHHKLGSSLKGLSYMSRYLPLRFIRRCRAAQAT